MRNKWVPTFRHHCKRSHLLPKLPSSLIHDSLLDSRTLGSNQNEILLQKEFVTQLELLLWQAASLAKSVQVASKFSWGIQKRMMRETYEGHPCNPCGQQLLCWLLSKALVQRLETQPGTWVCSNSYPCSGDICHQHFQLEHFRWLRACAAATFAGSVKAPCKTSRSWFRRCSTPGSSSPSSTIPNLQDR